MFPSRYTPDNLLKVFRDPSLIIKEIRTLNQNVWGDAAYTLQKKYFIARHGPGTLVMEEDWDNLLILDACRYDTFSEHNDIAGDLQSRISRGSHSEEFMRANFEGKRFHDTVYVSANPHISKLPEGTFHDVFHLTDAWDPEVNTIYPSDVVAAAVEAHEQYPEKRLIVHFMQPHTPYLGEKGDEMREMVNMNEWFKAYPAENSEAEQEFQEQTDGIKVKAAVKDHDIDIDVEDMWQGYRETLEIVLNNVNDLLGELDGESVITADHGEMIGETVVPFTKKIYTHPRNVYTSQLRKVPWLVVDSDKSRRTITADPPVKSEHLDQQTVDDRLEALGYK